MARLALKILIPLALVWAGWWYTATTGMQSGATAWLEDRRAEGWQAQADDVARAGFPLRIGTALTGLALDDPETKAALRIQRVTLSSPIYWPGDATLALSPEPITLSTPDAVLTVTSDGTTAAMQLHPGPALQLEALAGQSDNLTLDLVEGRVLRIGALRTDVKQKLDPQTYDIDLVADGFAPGSLVRQAMRLPVAWPEAFETLIADTTVTFDRPWDRYAIETTRPQPRAIVIDRIEAAWADLSVSARANLTVGEGGVLSGTFALKAQNWQRMLDLAVAGGALAPQMRPQIESGLSLLAGLSGNADALDIEITMDRGRMRMGFIPLGDAPRLILR